MRFPLVDLMALEAEAKAGTLTLTSNSLPLVLASTRRGGSLAAASDSKEMAPHHSQDPGM